MEFTKFLKRARDLRKSQFDSEYDYLELLVAQEADKLSWKKPKTSYETWSEVLREEGLFAVSSYRNYKKARGLLDASWIKKLGVYASISVAKLDLDTRVTILTKVKKWYSDHQTAPTYQRVSKYVRDLGRSSRKQRVENKVQKMKAYIRVCQDLLKKNKISIPKETWK